MHVSVTPESMRVGFACLRICFCVRERTSLAEGWMLQWHGICCTMISRQDVQCSSCVAAAYCTWHSAVELQNTAGDVALL